MIRNNICFYNIAELKAHQNGFLLYRYPSKVITQLGYQDHHKGKEKAKVPAMAEIRIRTSNTIVGITLKALDHDAHVVCYLYDLQNGEQVLKKGKTQTLYFKMHERLEKIYGDALHQGVEWRFIFSGESRIVFYEITSEVQLLPIKERAYALVYGSSISQGVGALNSTDGYIFKLQTKRKEDILNKALSGSCLLEPATARYLATFQPKFYIFEFGANARGLMDEIEFSKRLDYFLQTITKFHPTTPIVLINILELFEGVYKTIHQTPIYHEKNVSFSRVMKKLVCKYNTGHIHLISGKQLVNRFDVLSADVLHPSNLGHEMISQSLMKLLTKLEL